MMTHTVCRTLIASLAAACLCMAGCDKKQANTADEDATATQAQSEETDAKTGQADGAGTCDEYATKFCEVVGAKTPTCQSMQTVSSLMPAKACDAGLADLDYTKTQHAELRKECETLVEKLCGDLGEETQSCKMVRERTPGFPPERCAQMMQQYDRVLAELKAQEKQNEPLEDAAFAKIADASKAPAFGDADAPVTIVEFSDFQCPYCRAAADVTNQIKEKYSGDKVRVVFRQFPLSFHQDAHLTAQAALAAHEQGKFWEYHDLVFGNQKALSREDLETYAKELDLNMTKFKKVLDDKTYASMVDSDLAMGKEVFVQGTPTMFINGERVSNPTDFGTIKGLIDAELKKAN